ncbi:MAG TPA: hypothetical protein PK691_05100 [Thermomicrobiales bacterium]|nr:hypothetical protein [Thermomicrobiales bacterium]HRA49066.1 hypothetical protein [Thermomicrobiales bacterium]
MSQLIRITFIDATGTVTFGAEGHIVKMITHICTEYPSSFGAVLDRLEILDPDAALAVRIGLARFDEFVIAGRPDSLTAWLADHDPGTGVPIRLIEPRLREYTLAPLPLGIIIFNLPDRRIIQIENTYGTILRKDRGRLRRNGRPVRQIYRYELSDDWSLLP